MFTLWSIQLKWTITSFAFPAGLNGEWHIFDANRSDLNLSNPNFQTEDYYAHFWWDQYSKRLLFHIFKNNTQNENDSSLIYKASIFAPRTFPTPSITEYNTSNFLTPIIYQDLPNDLSNASVTVNECKFDFFGENSFKIPLNVTCPDKPMMSFYAFHIEKALLSYEQKRSFVFIAIFVVILISVFLLFQYNVLKKEHEKREKVYQQKLLERRNFYKAKAERERQLAEIAAKQRANKPKNE